MLEAVLMTSFFGALAAAALWATYRDQDLRWLGGALVVSFIVSNLVFWAEHSGGLDRSVRPGIYSILEILIAVAAYCSWCPFRVRRCLIAIVAVSVLSICSNIAYSALFVASGRQIFVWELTTNLCFAAECALAIIVGMSHGFRTGRFSSRALHRRLPFESHAHREGP